MALAPVSANSFTLPPPSFRLEAERPLVAPQAPAPRETAASPEPELAAPPAITPDPGTPPSLAARLLDPNTTPILLADTPLPIPPTQAALADLQATPTAVSPADLTLQNGFLGVEGIDIGTAALQTEIGQQLDLILQADGTTGLTPLGEEPLTPPAPAVIAEPADPLQAVLPGSVAPADETALNEQLAAERALTATQLEQDLASARQADLQQQQTAQLAADQAALVEEAGLADAALQDRLQQNLIQDANLSDARRNEALQQQAAQLGADEAAALDAAALADRLNDERALNAAAQQAVVDGTRQQANRDAAQLDNARLNAQLLENRALQDTQEQQRLDEARRLQELAEEARQQALLDTALRPLDEARPTATLNEETLPPPAPPLTAARVPEQDAPLTLREPQAGDTTTPATVPLDTLAQPLASPAETPQNALTTVTAPLPAAEPPSALPSALDQRPNLGPIEPFMLYPNPAMMPPTPLQAAAEAVTDDDLPVNPVAASADSLRRSAARDYVAPNNLLYTPRGQVTGIDGPVLSSAYVDVRV